MSDDFAYREARHPSISVTTTRECSEELDSIDAVRANISIEKMDDGRFWMHISAKSFSRTFSINTRKRGRVVIIEEPTP